MKDSNCGQKNDARELYSYHTFLFPFRWDCCNKNNSRSIYDTAYQDRLDIEKFSRTLTKNQSGWSYARFEINDNKDFNEYVYFYKMPIDLAHKSNVSLSTMVQPWRKNIGNVACLNSKGNFLPKKRAFSIFGK